MAVFHIILLKKTLSPTMRIGVEHHCVTCRPNIAARQYSADVTNFALRIYSPRFRLRVASWRVEGGMVGSAPTSNTNVYCLTLVITAPYRVDLAPTSITAGGDMTRASQDPAAHTHTSSYQQTVK